MVNGLHDAGIIFVINFLILGLFLVIMRNIMDFGFLRVFAYIFIEIVEVALAFVTKSAVSTALTRPGSSCCVRPVASA